MDVIFEGKLYKVTHLATNSSYLVEDLIDGGVEVMDSLLKLGILNRYFYLLSMAFGVDLEVAN